METFNEIKTLIQTTEEDVTKFFSNGNKLAGTRARKACQELKKLAQKLRIEIQSAKKVSTSNTTQPQA